MDRRLLLDIPDLPPEAFKHVGDKRIKPEGGGGKGGGGSTQTVQQSIPKELVPYVREVIEQGQKVTALPYVPYEGARVAGFTPEQMAVQSGVMSMQTPAAYSPAISGLQSAGSLAQRVAEQGVGQGIQRAGQAGDLGFNVAQTGLSRGLEGAEAAGRLGMQTAQTGLSRGIEGATAAGRLGMQTAQAGIQRALGFQPGVFGQREAQFYSSPYQQAVTDIALREAQRAGDIERRNAALQGAARGTLGGSAQALREAELARNLMQQRGDIQARGSEAAFLAAQQQFERDRAAAALAAGLGRDIGAGGLSQAVETSLGLTREGGANLGRYLEAALGQGQLGQAGLGTALQSGLGIGQIGQAGLGSSVQAALGLGELAGAQQKAELAKFEAQRQIAQQVQDREQRMLDMQYQDFLAQRGYPREQLAFYSDIVRGNAPLFGTVTQTTQPAPSLASQVGGLGLAGLSLYNLAR